jgi:DNA-binding beta-propeller fold protein YncE
VYPHGGGQPARTITSGVWGPYALVVHAGKLFVANSGNDTVTAYGPAATQPKFTISHGIRGPESLAFDKAGDLYVANSNNNSVTEYLPGKLTQHRTITDGIAVPTAVLVDSNSNLFVANRRTNTVAVFQLVVNHLKPPRIIKGLHRPIAMAFADGALFVLNLSNNTLAKYDTTTLARLGIATSGVACPSGLSADAAGNVFVSNTCPSSISVFDASTVKLVQSITNGVSYPSAVTVSP